MEIKLLKPIHAFSSNTYLVSSNRQYAVVDPSVPFDPSLIDGELKYVFLTHSHFDHMLDIDGWADVAEKVVISEYEVSFLRDPAKNCYSLFFNENRGFFGEAYGAFDGEVFPLGEDEFRLIRTPGHSIGSSLYLSGKYCFAGDTVFAGGGYGRWDLPSGDYEALKASIEKVKLLDEDIILLPGHGESTTVKQYKVDFKR